MDDSKNHNSTESRICNLIRELYDRAGIVETILSATNKTAWDKDMMELQAKINHPVFSETYTFDYDKCYTYSIFVNFSIRGRGPLREKIRFYTSEASITEREFLVTTGRQNVLNLYISALGQYYTFSYQRRYYRPTTGYWTSLPPTPLGFAPDTILAVRVMRQFFEDRGYECLTDSLLRKKVRGVTLDLAPPDRTNVLNCLFFDYDTSNEGYAGAYLECR